MGNIYYYDKDYIFFNDTYAKTIYFFFCGNSGYVGLLNAWFNFNHEITVQSILKIIF